jgi:hypothetical protein
MMMTGKRADGDAEEAATEIDWVPPCAIFLEVFK